MKKKIINLFVITFTFGVFAFNNVNAYAYDDSPNIYTTGLSLGAIVAIVIGGLLVLSIIVVGILYILHKEEIINVPFFKKNK